MLPFTPTLRSLNRFGIILAVSLVGLMFTASLALAAPQVAPRILMVGETCFATLNGTTLYSSTDAQAVRDAVGAPPTGALTCGRTRPQPKP